MGPVQTRHIPGRGDKFQSAEQTLHILIQTELDNFCTKYSKLDQEAQDELQALFEDEDVGDLLADEYVKEMAEIFIADNLYEPEDQKAFLEAICAFLDAHPIQLTTEEQFAVEEKKIKRKAKIHPGTDLRIYAKGVEESKGLDMIL